MIKDFALGSILDFTREGDDSPFIGIVVYDDDLEEKVIYQSNGGYCSFEDIEKAIFSEVENIDDFKENFKTRFPNDFVYIVKFLNKYLKFKMEIKENDFSKIDKPSCVSCHQTAESNRELTKELFLKLRGKDLLNE